MAGIDVLIRGAKVVDGTGNPWFRGDVALAGDRVEAVAPAGRLPADGAGEVVDADGLVVCPGFIDIQSHSIVPLMLDGRCLSKIMQGVTTEIMGEAWTPTPTGGRLPEPLTGVGGAYRERLQPWAERARGWRRFGDWLAAMEATGVSPNVGSFLGGGTLRRYAKGMDTGPADGPERETLRRVMDEAMADGAFGVAYALIYPPDAYVDTDEIVDVCRVVAKHGGVYITHVRSEGDRLVEGIEEALEIGRRSGAVVEIYHLKAAGRQNWYKMPSVIDMIDRARDGGLDVTADMYPYVASGTGLSSVLPPWVSEGGRFFENLRDPATRERIRHDVLNPSGDWEALADQATPAGVMPVGLLRPELKRFNGRRLTEIAADLDKHWLDTVFELLLAEEQRIGTIYYAMTEENLVRQIRQPWIKISTDAGGMDPAWAAEHGPVHPRAYGTYTRVLGKYVREEGVIPLEDAVRKMSSSVADRVGLRDRGLLRAGCFADVVVFDERTVTDNATFEQPHRLSTGVRDVWVNGGRVVKDGRHTGATPGRFVKGPGAG